MSEVPPHCAEAGAGPRVVDLAGMGWPETTVTAGGGTRNVPERRRPSVLGKPGKGHLSRGLFLATAMRRTGSTP